MFRKLSMPLEQRVVRSSVSDSYNKYIKYYKLDYSSKLAYPDNSAATPTPVIRPR